MSTELGKALSRSNKTKNEDFSRLTLVLPFLIEIRIIINEVWLVRDEPFGLYGIYHVINQVYIPVNNFTHTHAPYICTLKYTS